MSSAFKRSNGLRWKADVLIWAGVVVGTVSLGASGSWFAYGCLDDWEDTRLGVYEHEADARQRVEEWAGEHIDC